MHFFLIQIILSIAYYRSGSWRQKRRKLWNHWDVSNTGRKAPACLAIVQRTMLNEESRTVSMCAICSIFVSNLGSHNLGIRTIWCLPEILSSLSYMFRIHIWTMTLHIRHIQNAYGTQIKFRLLHDYSTVDCRIW